MKKILNCAAAVIAAAAILGVQSCTSDPVAPENPGSNETPETPGTEVSATIEVSDIDLWSNTAKVSVSAENIDDLKVYYGVKDSGVSHEIEAEGGVYTISAGYTASKNDAGLDIYSLVEGTGVFAGKTYVVEVFDGAPSETNLPVASKEFSTDAGDVIPNGDMSGWSTKGEKALPYPNAEGESFWDSGNNDMACLCQEDPDQKGVAFMSANLVLGFVFAPGNMYTGDFTMDGLMGTANFGKVFNWTARPAALKVSYKAAVGKIDKEGSNDPEKGNYKDKQDTSRVYAVVIDWTKQHGVTSGMGTPAGMWDPATAKNLDEGAILGYAILDITADQKEFTDAEIPFVWYDTVTKPAEGNYSIVISCATSKRGDYLTGCSTNRLWVDNFGFVY